MDNKTKSRCKRTIRQMWTWSKIYKDLIEAQKVDRGKYRCKRCRSLSPKTNIYLEHINSLELLIIKIKIEENRDISLEEYDKLMRDTNNVQVWCKQCKPQKDLSDNRNLTALKKYLKNK